MPTLPPGTANYANLTFTPTWIFTPNTSASNNVRLWNNGSNIVYVGQSNVTQGTGLPIPPGGKPIELSNVTSTLYAISAYQLGTLLGTVSTSATAGTSTLIWTSTVPTHNLPVAATFMVGSTANTANQEILAVATSVSTTSNTTV